MKKMAEIVTEKFNVLQVAVECDETAGISNLEQFYQVDNEITDFKSKLLECRKEYECTEMEMYDVSQLNSKGEFVLKDMERKYKEINVELEKVHCVYVKCVNKVNCYEENVYRKINSLTLQRDNLRKELIDLKKVTDENSKKLLEINKLITVHEKKNIALLRKLNKMAERTSITQELKEKVNAVLCDPRITKANVSNQNIK